VPLVPAGRRDLYAGFFRADGRGGVRVVAAPRVGTPAMLLEAVAEAKPLLDGAPVRFIGPGAARERALLEQAHPDSTSPEMRFEGLSAVDLADASLSDAGPRAGLPPADATPHPLYVRAAQAEERVRHRAVAGDPIVLRQMRDNDLSTIAAMELEIFSDPGRNRSSAASWPSPPLTPSVAEREGEIVGYSAAWVAEAGGHLGNLAVAPAWRRRGIARKLVERLLDDAEALGCPEITLEVRASNSAAQALYRAFGFRLAGLRRGYYRDTGEDALVMTWRTAGRMP
jgi:ribosomal-protein-alanine N-acetyltransferase